MSETIKGLRIRAKAANGKNVEQFKVKWIGQLVFGIINEDSTDKEFLELYTPELEALEAENKELKERKPCRKPKWNGCVSRETYEGHTKELRAEIKDLKNTNVNVEFDLNYYKAIFDGSWPQAVEILERALEKAKALKGD